MRRAAIMGVASVLLWVAPAEAKEVGVHTPSRRQIYDRDESFEEALDQGTRKMVVEVATGLAPEGSLAMLLGFLNVPVRRLDLFLGVGIEVSPARRYSASARYTFNLSGYRPYLSAGYVLVDSYPIGVSSDNVFGELGYSWIMYRTYHLSAGIGLRYVANVRIGDDSLLNDPDVDQQLLDEQLDDFYRLVPTAALRFSRAF